MRSAIIGTLYYTNAQGSKSGGSAGARSPQTIWPRGSDPLNKPDDVCNLSFFSVKFTYFSKISCTHHSKTCDFSEKGGDGTVPPWALQLLGPPMDSVRL